MVGLGVIRYARAVRVCSVELGRAQAVLSRLGVHPTVMAAMSSCAKMSCALDGPKKGEPLGSPDLCLTPAYAGSVFGFIPKILKGV